ncbi:alpha/beta fold hydrolase [Halosegnis marinus]|uniref:Alpha/beta fold hydrolase n=1 Tax=Halosegnis marinus TaxID=3034023 RepID=A0ABD5ZR31_9EURY|nr:alpha/beta hydrolase [Halosegnis sp. DT85]
MKLRYAALGLAGAVGGLAAANGGLRADGFEPPLSREQDTYRWRGFDVAYTDLGDPSDPDLVLLHGLNAAGSSHEFREIAEELAEEYHVVAPDLPGFGGSDRPPLMYSGSLYVAFVTDFLREAVDDPVVVASSLSAAYATKAAAEVPVSELFLVVPTATTVPGRRTWLRSVLRSPVVGEALYNALTSKRSIRWFLADHGFAREESITDEWVDYDWNTAHQPNARFAPASFVAGFLDLDTDLGADLAALDCPVTIVWGGEARMPDPDTGRELAAAADAPFVGIPDTDLLPHAEEPAAFLDAFRER